MRASRKTQRTSSLESRSSDQNIAVSHETWTHIKDFFVGQASFANRAIQPLDTSLGDSKGNLSASQGVPDFYFIHQTQTNVKLSRSNYLQKTQIEEQRIQRVQVQLKSYIPMSFRHCALLKDERLLNASGSHLKRSVFAMAIELN